VTLKARKSESIFRRRLRRFRSLRRGYYSFLLLVGLYLASFLLPFLMNDRAIVVRFDGNYYFPSARTYLYDTFGIGSAPIYLAEFFGQKEVNGRPALGETNYRVLQETFAKANDGNWVLMPFFPYSKNEQFFDEADNPPNGPSWAHWMGTDDRGRDVMVRLAYGFQISISFALLVTSAAYLIGITFGAMLGYMGGKVDLIGVRLVEIWGAIPFLYTVIILASLFRPSFPLLVGILAMFGWLGITYYIRGEFYREKARDYVAAAVAAGESTASIIFRHILPNALTPIVSLAPFAIVAEISALVALDFLGFGLPAPTPSWGELIGQGKANIMEWHLVVFPFLAIIVTLLMIVFIGEAIREAFDPKVFSRLR
jgi:microcin C transport system permease protein